MKTALITGITGQDGAYLAEFLLRKGYEVHGVVRRSSSPNRSRFEGLLGKKAGEVRLHYGDVTDGLCLAGIFRKTQPDEIYHLAAQSFVPTSFAMPEYTGNVNALGVLNVLEAAKNACADAKIYQASTSEMFGNNGFEVQDESRPMMPCSPYAIAKLYGYHIARNYREAYGMFAANGILFNHESPLRGEEFVTRKITKTVAEIHAGVREVLAVGNWMQYETQDFTQTRTHNAANEITTINGQPSVASDKAGNMTRIPRPENWGDEYDLTHDAWNRLVRVKDVANVSIAEYFYDGLNRRVKKATDNETRVFYYNDDWQCLEEFVGNTQSAQYLWGLRYIDDLVRVSLNGQWLNVLADTNWNVVALTSGSAVVERYTYTAFGKRNVYDANFNPKTTSSYPAFTRAFTGQVLDSETGLLLYRMRFYHSVLGRFIQRDPIGYDAEDINLYRYVTNNPIIYADPTGNAWWHRPAFPWDVYENDKGQICGYSVWLLTGRWCAAPNVVIDAADAHDEFVTCWWKCEIETHKCIAGKILMTVETISGSWSTLTSRMPKHPSEVFNPKDKLKGRLRDIINKLGGKGGKYERWARAMTRGNWKIVAGAAKGVFIGSSDKSVP